MRSIIYFFLLVTAFWSMNLCAVEQFQDELNEEVETSEHENDAKSIKKNFKQNLPSTKQEQEDELEHRLELKSSDLNVEDTKENESEKVEGEVEDEIKIPSIRKTEEHDKIFVNPNNIISDKSVDKSEENLQKSEIDQAKENKHLEVDSENVVKENREDVLQIDDKVKENEDVLKIEIEPEKESDSQNRKKREKPIAKRPIAKEEETEKEENKELQKWTELNKEPVKEWKQKYIQNRSIYKREYDTLNEHLPRTVFVNDYSKQLFYCIKKNNLLCLRGVIAKLEKLGLTTKKILELRNKLGDTLLIYAVKQAHLDVVRFLLLQGADLKAVNYAFKSPIDIATEKRQIAIINVIAEMTPYLLDHKEISNQEDSEMYSWALTEKENKKSQCLERVSND